MGTIFQEIATANAKVAKTIDKHSLQHEFRAVDATGKGTVDAKGLITIFSNLGLELKSDTINDVIFLVEENGNASIGLDKLVEIFETAILGEPCFTPRSRVI